MEQVTEAIAEGTGTRLLRYIEQNPGIRYRELLRLTGLANGVLTYHLAALEKLNAIKVSRRPRMTHYYPISISDKESEILQHLRHEPVRQIVLFILRHDLCAFNEIVSHTQKTPSTISSHIKKLKEARHNYSEVW
ncbi:MAG: winged helix-turn-helix transcriptional regulator [Nitrososphaera sp.]